MSSKKIDVIYETLDYDLFVTNILNRDLHNLEPLKAEMVKDGFLTACAIHTCPDGNGKLIIKAGHHRFHAAKELGIPIKYIVSYDKASIPGLEISRKWSIKDYLGTWTRAGLRDYAILGKFYLHTRMPLIHCICMLSGLTATNRRQVLAAFKNGLFRVKSMAHAKIVAEIVDHCAKHDVSHTRSNFFINAISQMCVLPEFNAERFKNSIVKYGYRIGRQPSARDYLLIFEEVYNFRNKVKVSLAFRAHEMSESKKPANFKIGWAVNKKKG